MTGKIQRWRAGDLRMAFSVVCKSEDVTALEAELEALKDRLYLADSYLSEAGLEFKDGKYEITTPKEGTKED